MTTPYHIKIAPAALRRIFELKAQQQRTLLKLIEALAINPRPPGCIKIEGMMGLYQETVENLRLIYKVEEQEIILLLVK